VAKQPTNHGKDWTASDVQQLKQLAKGNTPTRVIGLEIGRTPDAVKQKASSVGISLKPTNQAPYNRRGK
jgi:ABC-type Zn uptake system ZnuABC Zn-binding protein ZnuA